jgi:hypothetical protein
MATSSIETPSRAKITVAEILMSRYANAITRTKVMTAYTCHDRRGAAGWVPNRRRFDRDGGLARRTLASY